MYTYIFCKAEYQNNIQNYSNTSPFSLNNNVLPKETILLLLLGYPNRCCGIHTFGALQVYNKSFPNHKINHHTAPIFYQECIHFGRFRFIIYIQSGDFIVKHIHREGNAPADYLAKFWVQGSTQVWRSFFAGSQIF